MLSTITKQNAECTICPPIGGVGGIADVDLFACFDVADNDNENNAGFSWNVEPINVAFDRSLSAVVDDTDKKTYLEKVRLEIAERKRLGLEV